MNFSKTNLFFNLSLLSILMINSNTFCAAAPTGTDKVRAQEVAQLNELVANGVLSFESAQELLKALPSGALLEVIQNLGN